MSILNSYIQVLGYYQEDVGIEKRIINYLLVMVITWRYHYPNMNSLDSLRGNFCRILQKQLHVSTSANANSH